MNLNSGRGRNGVAFTPFGAVADKVIHEIDDSIALVRFVNSSVVNGELLL